MRTSNAFELHFRRVEIDIDRSPWWEAILGKRRHVWLCARVSSQVETQVYDDGQEREYNGCFEGPEKTLEVGQLLLHSFIVSGIILLY